jgi:integrase
MSDVVSLAIQIILAETTGAVVYDKGVARLLIIDPNRDSQAKGSPSPLFREFAQTRYLPASQMYLRPGAQKIYEFVLRRYVMPEIGSLRLADITHEIVQGLVAKMLARGYSVQTAKHAKMVTHRVFVHAERVGAFRGRLPTEGIRFPAMVRREKHALTIDQARSVLANLRSPYREMALISMTTSMNVAELFGLKWKRINLSSEAALCDGELVPPESLMVRESYYEGAFGPPKTLNRKRNIPLTKVVVVALQRLKASSQFSDPDDVVFASRKGTPRQSSNVRHQIIKPLGKKLGIPWLNLHTFRYTYATIGEQLGISLSDRQAQMGHGSIWMTQEYTVSHVENRRAGSELIAEMIA